MANEASEDKTKNTRKKRKVVKLPASTTGSRKDR